MPARLYEVLHARLARLDHGLRQALTRIALAADPFTADELTSLSALPEDQALQAIDAAIEHGVIKETDGRYRFRHAIVRDALVHALPRHRLAVAHRDVADRLRRASAAPARIAHHLLEGDRPREAVPWLGRAAAEAAGLAAYGDGLRLVETALEHASDVERSELAPLRADLLAATGDSTAPAAYGEALARVGAERSVELRVKQARALLMTGDVPRATALLAGLSPTRTKDVVWHAILSGMAAWFRGDLELARDAAARARPLAVEAGLLQETAQVVQLQAAVAHSFGDWGSAVELDIPWTLTSSDLAETVFDFHLCVAELVLTSGEPYAPLAKLAANLARTAERSGAQRAHAFALTVLGEVELLMGDLVPAEEHLRQAADLGRQVGSSCEVLARARLGEVLAATGRAGEAAPLLDEALALARFSPMSNHLVYLVYATTIRTAADPGAALAAVEDAESTLEPALGCVFCPTAFQVAATIGCARAGDLTRARAYLERSEFAASVWGGIWPAAVTEARAAVAFAEGVPDDAAQLFDRAAEGFARKGQPLSAERARSALASAG